MPSVRRTSYPIPSPSPNYSSSSSTTTSASASDSDRSPPMSDEDGGFPSPRTSPPSQTSKDLLPLPPPPPSAASRASPFPVREDCWLEDATRTLIDAWGSHYLELNRGSLRQKHWQEVADAVNAAHGHSKKLRRTDVQCKNRIDTLKKKYKAEKFKAIQSKGRFYSDWPFFTSLDSLIGESFIKSKPSSASPPATRRSSARNAAASQAPVSFAVKRDFPTLPPPPSAVPVGPRSKRPAPMRSGAEETMYRRNFLAAPAPVEEVADDDDEDSETSTPLATARVRPRSSGMGRMKRRSFSGDVTAEGYRELGEAIRGFAVIYERIEEAKQKQMVELEKQRMQFAKDLEIQRMKLFMESQVQLEKMKRSTPNASQSGGY